MISPLAAITARRQEIQAELERLQQEDRELAGMEEALTRLRTEPSSTQGAAYGSGRPFSSKREAPAPLAHRPPKSHRELVIAALSNSAKPWLQTNDVIGLAKQRWGAVISDKSLRPLLTVMKREGVIVRDGRWIALRERAREKARSATN